MQSQATWECGDPRQGCSCNRPAAQPGWPDPNVQKVRGASTNSVAPPRLDSVATSINDKAYRRLQGGQAQQLAADC